MSYMKKLSTMAVMLLTTVVGTAHAEYFFNSPLSCCSELVKGVFVRADLLCWQARQEGLDFDFDIAVAQETEVTTTAATTETELERFHNSSLSFDWRCGFRVGLGYDFNCGGLNVAAYYTNFRGHGHTHNKFSGLDTSGNWHLDYDVLDVEASGPLCCVGSCFTWQPYGGIRAARLGQKERGSFADFTTFTATGDVFTESSEGRFAYHSVFRGIGPKIGVKGDWNLGCNFSVYGNIAGSFLFSYTKNKFFNKTTDIRTSVTPVETPVIIITDEYETQHARRCQPVLDLGLGIRWHKQLCICDFSTDLFLQLGWEHYQWFDNPQFAVNKDLCIDGFTFAAEVVF